MLRESPEESFERERLLERDSTCVQHDPSPKDRFHAVYIIFYVLGVGSLLPWNFFSNAEQYFMYKLRNTSIEGDASWTNVSYFTQSQTMFENYLELAALLPAVVFMFVNTAATKVLSVRLRVTIALCLMIVMFTLTVIITNVDTDNWQYGFLILSLLTIVFMNAGSAVLQGAICGLASIFPHRYMQAVMGGMGLGGLIAAAANVFMIAISPSPLWSGFGYFLTAELVLVIGLIGFILLYRLEFAKFSMSDIRAASRYSVNSESSEFLVAAQHTLWSIFKLMWVESVCVLVIFLTTLSCYPAIISAIRSTQTISSSWTNVYFAPVTCFLLLNLMDFVGRTIASFTHWPSSRSVLLLFCCLRLLFIPIFLLCNVQPRYHLPVLLDHDSIPIIAVCLFGLSNGYLATNCMMAGPRRVSAVDVETAGSMMSFFLSFGLGLGALLSIALKVLV